METTELQQAHALKLLLTITAGCTELARQFSSMDGYAMLSKVLASRHCQLGFHILKVRTSTSQLATVVHVRSETYCRFSAFSQMDKFLAENTIETVTKTIMIKLSRLSHK